MLRGCVVEHLRRRFEPPAGEVRAGEQTSDTSGWGARAGLRLLPFTGLPQTLEVLPGFPGRLWRRGGRLLRWEVGAVVTGWC